MKKLFLILSILVILGQISNCQNADSNKDEDENEVLGGPITTARPNTKLNSKKILKKQKKVLKLLKKTGAPQNLDDGGSTTPLPPILPGTEAPPPPPPPKAKAHLSQRHRLRDHLLDGYDVMAHPVTDHDKPVAVDIGMALIHVDIEESTSIITVDAWMRLTWTDENIVWNETEYGDLTQMHFGEKELWRPDILLYNNADGTNFNPYGNAHFLVQSDGEVLWVPPAHLRAFCKLDFTYWPMETQDCKLKFGSWTSHGNEIKLGLYQEMKTIEQLNFYTNNREWVVKDRFAYNRTVRYDCCPEDYPEVTFQLVLTRNAPAYKSLIVLPCLVIMLMTICSYLLPPTAGEKLILNGFGFIACIMYLIYFSIKLPFHQSVPIIVMLYSNTCALIGIGMLLNAVCLNMSRVRRYSGPPKFLKGLFAGSVGRLLCLGNYAHQTSSTHQRLVLELTDMAESEQGTGNNEEDEDTTVGLPKPDYEQSGIMRDWVLVAAGLERMFFILYSIIFAVVTTTYL